MCICVYTRGREKGSQPHKKSTVVAVVTMKLALQVLELLKESPHENITICTENQQNISNVGITMINHPPNHHR